MFAAAQTYRRGGNPRRLPASPYWSRAKKNSEAGGGGSGGGRSPPKYNAGVSDSFHLHGVGVLIHKSPGGSGAKVMLALSVPH